MGGVWVGGSPAGWVGVELWTPPPLIILRVSWVGLLPPLLSLLTGALSGCLLAPPSALLLCRHHAKISLWLWRQHLMTRHGATGGAVLFLVCTAASMGDLHIDDFLFVMCVTFWGGNA